MGSRRLIGKELREGLTTFMRFHVPSKIYHYSNYIQMVGEEGSLKFTLSLIIGEAINTGMVVIKVPYEGDDFKKVTVPADDIKKLMRILPNTEDPIEFSLPSQGKNYIEWQMPSLKHRTSITDVLLPAMLTNQFKELREAPEYDFPLEDIQDVLKVMGKEITNTTVSFNFHGIYMTKRGSYTTNTMTIEEMKEPLEIQDDIYMPFFASKMLTALPKGDYVYSQVEVDSTTSPMLYVRGETIEFFFQEWMSKDVYPIEGILNVVGNEGLPISIQDVSNVVAWLKPNADVLTLDFRNGVARDVENVSEVQIATQDIDPISFHTSLLPSSKDMAGYSEASIVGGRMLKLDGFLLTKVINNMEV